MPLIDITSNRYQGLNTFFQLVALNIIYVICCLPIVTIGAATTALLEVMLKFSDNERGYLLRGYFTAFGRNFARGTAVFAALGIPTLVAIFAAVFWFQSGISGIVIGYAAGILLVLFIVLLVGAMIFAFALVAGYAAPIRQTLRNALLLALAEPLRTLGLVLMPVAMFAIAFAVPAFWFLWLTIGFAFAAYMAAIILRGVFTRRGNTGDDDTTNPQNPSLIFGSLTSPHSGE